MLGSFNKTVLMVACILLILGLVLIGLFVSKNIEKSAFPPIVGDCPDYWNVGYTTGGATTCSHNSINVGRSSETTCRTYPPANTTTIGTSVNDIICAKHRWAKGCNIHWDGITNNSQACLETTI